jgi:hypothetical protein
MLGAAKDTVGKLGLGEGMRVFVTNMPGGGLGGMGGAAGKGASGLQKALGVAGAVAVAGAAGYAVGTAIDRASGGRVSGFLSKQLSGGAMGDKVRRMEEDAMSSQFRQKLSGANAARIGLVAALESQGMSHGQAVYQAGQAMNSTGYGQQKNVTNLVVDGRVLASVVTEHQARGIRNLTANGAAPGHSD